MGSESVTVDAVWAWTPQNLVCSLSCSWQLSLDNPETRWVLVQGSQKNKRTLILGHGDRAELGKLSGIQGCLKEFEYLKPVPN